MNVRVNRLTTGVMIAAGCAVLLATASAQTPAADPGTRGAQTAAAGDGTPRGHLFRPRHYVPDASATPGSGAATGQIIYSPTDNLPPGSGDVMTTTQVFLIYWTPNNTLAASYKNLLARFSQDLNGTPLLNIVTQYYGNNGTIQDVVTYGGSWTDTATAYNNWDSSHTGTAANPIQDSDIQHEVDNAIAANGWPTGLGNMFLVFTESGIESCNGSDCTPGVNNKYCAYHNWFGSGSTQRIYANMPFVNTPGWDCNNTNGTPNNADADREISTYSHELFEAITDPHPNDTWTDTNCGGNVTCGEIGDKCSYYFPGAANADGSSLTLHGNPYNVQPEWSNATFTALGGSANDGCTYAYQPADMGITKTAPGSVTAGTNFDYLISVNSNGSPTAETPHFTDALDSHLQFQAITKPAGWACNTPSVGASGNIDCYRTNNAAATDGSMNSGDTASFVVTARPSPSTPNGYTLGNTGQIAWDGEYLPVNDTAGNVHLSKTSAASSTVITSADLTISKSTLGTAVAGSDFRYIIDVENDGPSDAQNVTATDSLPAGTTFVSITGSGGFSCSGTGPVTCTKSTMAAGAIASLTLTVHIPANAANGSVITNSASVTSTTSDPNTANNAASVSATVTTSADLSVTKSGPTGPVAGTDVTYTISASNSGPSDAQSVQLSDTVAANTTFKSLSVPAGWNCTTPAAGTAGPAPIACTTSTFAAGGNATFSLVVHVGASLADGSQLCDTAGITSSTADANTLNNSAQTCGTVRTSADLALTQTATTTGSPGKGTATFTLKVKNNGPSDSQNVSLVANSSLFSGPPPSINASSGGTCSVSGSTVTCTWVTLALGGTDTVAISVPWRSAVGQVCDSASVTAGTPDPNTLNNSSTACVGKK